MASNHWKPSDASSFSLAPGRPSRLSPPPSRHFGSNSNNTFHQSNSFSSFPNTNNSPFCSNEMPPIGHFSASNLGLSNRDSPSNNHHNNSSVNNTPAGTPATNGGFREAGIVEKLLPSYGFIQCCERQARLFFHYSQFTGNIEHLKLGDPVEFEMTYDRRTGKPIASYVIKIASEAIIGQEISLSGSVDGESSTISGTVSSGFITTEPTHHREGRVAYENRGECFFLPFTKDDLADSSLLSIIKSNDKVTFKIATDKSGNLRAKNVSLLSQSPDRLQGIICTLKDSFGFIDRSDVVKEIFFHSSECNDFKSLLLGDDVEFSIQTRNDKKVAVNVRRLPPGTVQFEEVSKERITGQVIKLCERQSPLSSGRNFLQQQLGINVSSSSGSFFDSSSNLANPPTPPNTGMIRFQGGSIEQEIKFSDKDVAGDFTLLLNDWVTFNISTDKRDGSKKAAKILLHEDFDSLTGEPREQGYIASLRENYGFIKCLNSEGTRVYFKLSELVEPNVEVNGNDEVEFTAQVDHHSIPPRIQAIRIKTLPNGTIMRNLLNPPTKTPSSSNSSFANSSFAFGAHKMNGHGDTFGNSMAVQRPVNEYPLIDFTDEGDNSRMKNENRTTEPSGAVTKDSWTEILSQMPITLNQNDVMAPMNGNGGDYNLKNKVLGRGYIAALKDTFGFIENEDHQTEVFFHFSVFDGNISVVDLGQEVEYTASIKGQKHSADHVKTIGKGEIIGDDVLPQIMSGMIVRSVRCLNPDQDAYPGLIKVNANLDATPSDSGANEPVANQYLEFSMTSLADIHEFVQKNDTVTFQIGVDKKTGRQRAVNVKPIRNKHKATVDAIKGSYGFLNYETADDGKKLFFHMSELQGNETLNPGDTVEFTIVYNQRSNKPSACTLTRCKSDQQMSQRPEHLISKIKLKPSADMSQVAKIVLIRQPRAPDGNKGFSLVRSKKSTNGTAMA